MVCQVMNRNNLAHKGVGKGGNLGLTSILVLDWNNCCKCYKISPFAQGTAHKGSCEVHARAGKGHLAKPQMCKSSHGLASVRAGSSYTVRTTPFLRSCWVGAVSRLQRAEQARWTAALGWRPSVVELGNASRPTSARGRPGRRGN